MRAWTFEEVRSLATGSDDEIAAGAIEALQTEDGDVRAEACRLLARLSDIEARLRTTLQTDPRLALEAVVFLRQESLLGDVAALIRESPDASVRGRAAQITGLLGGKQFETEVAAALLDPSPRVRALAAAGLGALGSGTALHALRAAWSREADAGARVVMTQILDDWGALP